MKITKVTLKNINSIRGQHSIDFQESFSKHGVFLLTGDTGSGKTTILDAISVAIYGQTPRLSSKAELEQLITIGEKDSFAEVEFEVDKEVYKSYWGIRVKRTGTIDDSVMKLSKKEDGVFKTILEKKNLIKHEIEKITNLNFDRFTKTVILAQGSFDAFLKADEKEKSDLLEKITGTEIYKVISTKVYEKHKEKKQELQNISSKIDETKILKDDEVVEINDEISTKNKQKEKLSKEIKTLQTTIQNIKTSQELSSELEVKKELLVSLEKESLKLDEELSAHAMLIVKNGELFASFLKKESEKSILLDKAKEYITIQDKNKSILKEKETEFTKKENQLSSLTKSIDNNIEKKEDFEKSLVKIASSLSTYQTTRTKLEKQINELKSTLSKIDTNKLFTQKNELENMLKDIKRLGVLELSTKEIVEKQKLFYYEMEQNTKLLELKSKEKENIQTNILNLENLKLSALAIQNYEDARKHLKPDEECPLCGSTTHPYLINMPKFEDSIGDDLKDAKSELKNVDIAIKKYTTIYNDAKTNSEVSKSKLKNIADEIKTLKHIEGKNPKDIEKKLTSIKETIEKDKELKSSYEKAKEEFEKLKASEQKDKDSENRYKTDIKLIQNDISNLTNQSKSLEVENAELKKDIDEKNIQQTSIKDEITKLLDGKDLELFKKELKDEKTALEEQKQKLKSKEQEIKIQEVKNASDEENTAKSIDEILLKLKAIKLDAKDELDTLEENLKELSASRDIFIEDATVLKGKITQSDNLKLEQSKLYEEIQKQKKELLSWEILDKLIGKSDGGKFPIFVQNLTLGHLLSLANKHLSYLSDRYKLVKQNNDKLDISIIDGYFLDKKRGVKTLSGGERFLVSLSLALGLSDLVNDKIKVDSLFLDEGFGTLDEDTLNVAIESLEKLHLKGKLIGVISHVSLLKERISAQIQLKKKAGGSSYINIVN